jgi:hypothetical protein
MVIAREEWNRCCSTLLTIIDCDYKNSVNCSRLVSYILNDVSKEQRDPNKTLKALTKYLGFFAPTKMGDQFKDNSKKPLPNLWYKVYGQIVRQGHFLSGHPMSFVNDLISIPSGRDRRFKLYMVWFTFYNILYVINYIPIFVWGTEDDFKTYAFYICHTLVHLCVWVLLFIIKNEGSPDPSL